MRIKKSHTNKKEKSFRSLRRNNVFGDSDIKHHLRETRLQRLMDQEG